MSKKNHAAGNVLRRLGGVSLSVLIVVAILSRALPGKAAAPDAPKAYLDLFKDNAVVVLDTGTNKILSTIPVPAGPDSLTIAPDGQTVYVSSTGDTKISVIDTTTDKVTGTIEVGSGPYGLAVTPDGKH